MATALTLVAALAAAPQESRADTPVGPFRVALTSDIDTLNPFQAVYLTSTGILRYQYDVVVGVGENNELVPALASEWTTSPDGKVWTYTFPSGRTWSDGAPLTAEDARWTYQGIIDNEALQTANGSSVANFAKVEAPDPGSLVITLKEAQAANPASEMPIVPKHVWEKVDAATYANDKDTVGSGPYVIKSYQQGQSVELVANPSFWRGPASGGLTYVVYRNIDAAVQALGSGEIDFISGVTPAQFGTLQNRPDVTTNAGDGRRYTSVVINAGYTDAENKPFGDGNEALKDPLVRQAIMRSIDNDALIDRVLQGYGKPGVTQEPPAYAQYYGLAPGTEPYAFDAAEANRLLDQAGYSRGADGKRVGKDGKPLSLRLLVRNTDPAPAQVGDFMKSWLSDVGIELDVQAMSANQLNDLVNVGNFDLYISGWSVGPDPDYQLSINTCDSRMDAEGNGNSEANYCNPEFDELYAAQQTELDPAKRAELVKQAWSTMYRDAVVRPIYYQQQLEAYRSNFTGFIKQPSDGGVIAFQNYYWGFSKVLPASGGPNGAVETADAAPPFGLIALAVGLVIVLGGGGFFLARRRQAGAADRE